MTQIDLASAAGLNRSYLSMVELGKEGISLERAGRIAKALNCELAELVRQD